MNEFADEFGLCLALVSSTRDGWLWQFKEAAQMTLNTLVRIPVPY
jgi:hypothetical protein